MNHVQLCMHLITKLRNVCAEDIVCSEDDQTVRLVDGMCATFDNNWKDGGR